MLNTSTLYNTNSTITITIMPRYDTDKVGPTVCSTPPCLDPISIPVHDAVLIVSIFALMLLVIAACCSYHESKRGEIYKGYIKVRPLRQNMSKEIQRLRNSFHRENKISKKIYTLNMFYDYREIWNLCFN